MELKNYCKTIMGAYFYFRSVYIKDQLQNKTKKKESLIINLVDSSGQETH